ncbi:MAG: aldolase [Acidovorax sp.]|jgi:ribulose-5-phosphate 4-epimerase/fuculose-1-phosphate aldolase|nr:aldolase [Acidovorax sp.]
MNYLTEDAARAQIVRVGRSLFERGYAHSTAGNISVRLADGYLITPTDACLGFLEPQRLAKLNLEGRQVSGDRASKTIVLHRRIYESSETTTRPALCVLHTHSTHLVACSLLREEESELLPPITPYFVMKVGHVPHIRYHSPGSTQAAEEVADTITQRHNLGHPIRAVMLARLGPNVWHETPEAAMATLEELEETARLWLLARPHPLDESALEDLRQRFGAIW